MIDWKIKRPSQQGLFSFLERWRKRGLKNFEKRFRFCGETIFLQKTPMKKAASSSARDVFFLVFAFRP